MMRRVRGIEPRTLEGDEIGEKQRARVGGKSEREDDDDLLPSSIYSNFYRLRIIHLMLAC